MRSLMVFALFLAALPGLSSALMDKHEHMIQILKENKVQPQRRRQVQTATLECRKPLRLGGEIVCFVIVEGGYNLPNEVYEKLHGEKAVELSNLLLEFGVTPQLKRSIQRADVRCRLPEGKGTKKSVCEFSIGY